MTGSERLREAIERRTGMPAYLADDETTMPSETTRVTAGRDPDAPCMPLDGAIWHPDGYEFADEASVQDATQVTRRTAARRFAPSLYRHPAGDVSKVRVGLRYIRVHTRAEAWEVRYAADDDPDAPLPDGWWPDEEDPCWRFVHRDDPRACPVYVCVEAGEKLPDVVRASAGGTEA